MRVLHHVVCSAQENDPKAVPCQNPFLQWALSVSQRVRPCQTPFQHELGLRASKLD